MVGALPSDNLPCILPSMHAAVVYKFHLAFMVSNNLHNVEQNRQKYVLISLVLGIAPIFHGQLITHFV